MNYLYDLWDDFISFLFPRLCHGCGNQLLRNEKVICTECFVLIPRTGFHLIPEILLRKSSGEDARLNMLLHFHTIPATAGSGG